MKFLSKNYKYFAPLLILLFLTHGINAQIPKKPVPPRLVNDYVSLLDNNQINLLEQKLAEFANSTGNQIVVAVVDDLGGYDPGEFAFKLGEEWGIGQKGKDNGIVILIKPTGGEGERKVYISVGYGLEGVIPDAIANRIVNNELLPNFRQGKFYEGLNAASDLLISLANKEFSAEDYVKKTKANGYLPIIVVGIIIIFFLIGSMSRVRRYSSTNNLPFWVAMMMMSNSGRGTYNNFGSGSGGGFGGGGFGGFGGGSFGGGGAGGSW